MKTKVLTPVLTDAFMSVDAADDVVRVIEPLDEVAQAFGGVRGEMIDMVEPPLGEQAVHQAASVTLPSTKCAPSERSAESAAQIVEHGHVVATADQGIRDMRAEKPRSAGYQYSPHPREPIILT